MRLSTPLLFAFIAISFWGIPSSLRAEPLDYSASVALKSQYLGKIGTTVDNNNVIQPYLEITHESGLYGYLWLNLPLKDGNPKRSFEFEPSIGYRSTVGKWNWDAAVTLFDLQNPKTLDFSGDILSPNLKLNRGAFYTEAFYYAVDKGKNGWLTGVGFDQTIGKRTNLLGNFTYVDGPLHFEPILYAKLAVSVSLDPLPMSLFAEALDILEKKSNKETRTDQIALGVRYFF